ncbi:putative orphan protein [Pseudoalteromonas sp. JB197]|jgi:cell division protein ZapB|nr:putative orphan protein [Pseudoalteromonas sp. JB197]|tara:strand:+ start:3532 stop:3774 length:243 start_codon:yes stop_codon:yes gene_type:complete
MSAFMNNNTLQQLEQLIDQLIQRNNQLQADVSNLKEQNSKLADDNELLQLEALENEEKQKDASTTLSGLLDKLQSAQQAS